MRARIKPNLTAKRGCPQPSRRRANFSSQWNIRLPEKTQCFAQIRTFKSNSWCYSSTAICRQCFAKHNTIAPHFWRTSTFRETLAQPFHCDLPRLTCKTQKHSVRKEKKKRPEPSVTTCACKSSRIWLQSGDARNRRASEPTFLRNGTSVYSEKQTVSRKS